MARRRRAEQAGPPSIGATLSAAFANIRGVFLVLLLVDTLVATVVLLVFQPRLENAGTAYVNASDAHANVLDEQSALLSYLLTRDPTYLTQADADELAVGPQLMALGTTPFRQQTSEAVRAMLSREKAWQSGFARSVVAGSKPTAAALDTDARLFQPYEAATVALLSALKDDQEASVNDDRDALIGALSIGVLLFLGMAAASTRQSRRLERDITVPVTGLVETIEEIGQGNLAARAERRGPAELIALEDALRNMAASLSHEQERRLDREREIAAYAEDLHGILRSARDMSATLSLDDVLGAVAGATTAVTGVPDVTVWLSEARGLVQARTTRHDDGSRVVRAAAERLPVAVPEGEDAGLAVPMLVGGRVVGVIDLPGEAAAGFGPERGRRHIQLLAILAAHAGTAVESARLHAETERLSVTDELTQLPNRRRLRTDLAFEVERAHRFERPLSVVMVDVDFFKAYNDEHGHLEGDRVLAWVAGILARGVRDVDSVYRYGGEEFLALVREAGSAEAELLAERLRAAIEAAGTSGAGDGVVDGQMWPPGAVVPPDGPPTPVSDEVFAPGVTASFGVASLVEGDDPGVLVDAADDALYVAKQAGRNRVVVAERRGRPAVEAPVDPGGGDVGGDVGGDAGGDAGAETDADAGAAPAATTARGERARGARGRSGVPSSAAGGRGPGSHQRRP